MKKTLAILSVIFLASACHHQEHLCRSYYGVLPAADAPGIQTTVTFQAPDRYRNRLVFIDKSNGSFEETGRYRLQDDILTLTDSAGEQSFYRLEPNQIRRLDMEKQPITGTLAEHYVLKCTVK